MFILDFCRELGGKPDAAKTAEACTSTQLQNSYCDRVYLFSTWKGDQASDGKVTDGRSPYAAALLSNLFVRGRSLQDALKAIDNAFAGQVQLPTAWGRPNALSTVLFDNPVAHRTVVNEVATYQVQHPTLPLLLSDYFKQLADKKLQYGISGCEWFIQEFLEACDMQQHRIVLLIGEPGAGKSTLFAEMVTKRLAHRVIAFHFCSEQNKATKDPVTFVRRMFLSILQSSLARDFMRCQKPTGDDPTAAHQAFCKDESEYKDTQSLLERYVLTPVNKMEPLQQKFIIGIDALDESVLGCTNPSFRGTIAGLLHNTVQRFPMWLQLIATSRPDPTVACTQAGQAGCT